MNHSAHAHHGHHGHAGGGALRISAHATLHCLTGCIVGEMAGLLIGTVIGLSPWPMMTLATLLSYASGITLGLIPVMREQRLPFLGALKVIWLGEVISIGVMEIVMNLVDYQLGGMGAKSVLAWTFWRGLIVAVPAGFLAAWPVNYWLLKRELKSCH